MPTLTQIIADAYRKMVNPPQAVARPKWVPASVNEESVPAFVQAVTEARKANQSVVEFNGKKYGITVKEETNKEDDNKSKKIQDMDAENAPKQGQEEAPEEVKEEDSEEIKVANVADKEKDAEEMQKIAASEAPGDKRAEMAEELVGNQHKLDVNKNGKIDGDDLKKLRGEDDDVEEAKDWSGHVPIDWTDHGTLRSDVKSKLHGVVYKAGTTRADWRADHPTDPKHHAAAIAHVKAGGGSYRGGDAGYAESTQLTGEQTISSVAATYASMVNEEDEYAGDNPVDKLHLDVPAFIRVLERAREDFKTDEDIHNFTQQLLAMKSDCIHTEDLPSSPVKEGTAADAEAGPEVMDPVTQKAKDDTDDETELKDGVPGAAQDGGDKVSPADKPAAANSSAALPKVPVITAPVTTNESTESIEEQDDGTFYDGSNMLGEADDGPFEWEHPTARAADGSRRPKSYQFTHKPGDAESEKKLASLKTSMKGTHRIVMVGRLGKNNPNAYKYSRKNGGGEVAKKRYPEHSHQVIHKADAAHHDVYAYPR
jgi:hypothetical protein